MRVVVDLDVMSEWGRHIGEVVARFRENAGLSRAQLSAKIEAMGLGKLCENTIYKMEHGENTSPKLSTIEKIATALDADPLEMVTIARHYPKQKDRISAYSNSDYRKAEGVTDEEIAWLLRIPLLCCLGDNPTDKAITGLVTNRRDAARGAVA